MVKCFGKYKSPNGRVAVWKIIIFRIPEGGIFRPFPGGYRKDWHPTGLGLTRRESFLLLLKVKRYKVAAFWLKAMWAWQILRWCSSWRRLEALAASSDILEVQRIWFEVSDMAATSATGHFQVVGPFWLQCQQRTCWWTLQTNKQVPQSQQSIDVD